MQRRTAPRAAPSGGLRTSAMLPLAILPGLAHASFLPPELMDKAATYLAWFVIIAMPIAGVVLFWLVHILPEKIAHKRHHPQTDAIKTLCLLSLVFGGLLWPLAWLWAYAPEFARIAFLLLMIGFGVKAALVPLHGWLPSAMVAPTPVSGLLHAVAVVNTGVFGFLRLMWYLYGSDLMVELGLRNLVITAAVVTIIIGSLLALLQDDFKLRLAYSTVSQLSYMILGAAVLLPAGINGVSDIGRTFAVIGATYAFTAHAFGKLTMFFVAGAVAVETGKTRVSELDGLGRKMPWQFAAFTLATLSLVGLPPMAGFIAKWYLSLGIGAGNISEWWMLFILVSASVLNLAYFLPVIIRAFFRSGECEVSGVRWTLRGAVIVTAAGALILGLWMAFPNIAGGIGLGAAVDYLSRLGMEKVHAHEERLTARLIAALKQNRKVRLYAAQDPGNHIGVVSFTVDNLRPHEVAGQLDESADIMVRSGHHCCQPLMDRLGLPDGSVRASLGLFNTADEIDMLAATLEEITR